MRARIGDVLDPTRHVVTEWHRDGFFVTDDPARVDLDVVHTYLANESYWAAGRSRRDQEVANAASSCFSLFDTATLAQIGFARLLTDSVTFGWIADVFVLHEFQGRRLGHFLVGCVVDAAADVRRLTLGTRDAHGVYADLGFTSVDYPDRLMELLRKPLVPPLPEPPNRSSWGTTGVAEVDQ